MIAKGLITISSKHSVDQTVSRLTDLLSAKGITLFNIIDHSGEATRVGLSMPPTRVVIFGNPKSGTPLMLAAPSVAIDLPLKLLIAENSDGVATITWTTPEYLAERHNIPEQLLANIAVIAAIAQQAAE